jgi:predicted pyridoxine 5'-phosphate oxidase superfamily flavin-nucleotide-binding protein
LRERVGELRRTRLVHWGESGNCNEAGSFFTSLPGGITMIKMTDEMKDRVNNAFDDKKYCVWATTSSDGYPDLSFRGSTFVFDDERIAFWDRSLGTSSTNLENNPHVCMLYYDSAARTGWRFYGTATVYKEGDLRQQIMKRVVKGEIDKDPERKGYGVLVRVDKIRGYSGFNIVQEREKQ